MHEIDVSKIMNVARERHTALCPRGNSTTVLHRNARTGTIELMLVFPYPAGDVRGDIRFHSLREWLALECPSGIFSDVTLMYEGVRVWHVATGDELGRVVEVLDGHRVKVRTNSGNVSEHYAQDVCVLPSSCTGEAKIDRTRLDLEQPRLGASAKELIDQFIRMTPGHLSTANAIGPDARPGSLGATVRRILIELGNRCDQALALAKQDQAVALEEALRKGGRGGLSDAARAAIRDRYKVPAHEMIENAVDRLVLHDLELLEQKARDLEAQVTHLKRDDHRVAELSDRCGELRTELADANRIIGTKERKIAALERDLKIAKAKR